jgi:predicted nucleic acid-binding protein
MSFLFDTTVLVDASRQREPAVRLLSHWSKLTISAVSGWELIQSARDKRELRVIERFLAAVNMIEIDESISRKARALLSSFALSHGLHVLDALIAATALAHHRTLVTDNVRDFSFISGLAVMKPIDVLERKQDHS